MRNSIASHVLFSTSVRAAGMNCPFSCAKAWKYFIEREVAGKGSRKFRIGGAALAGIVCISIVRSCPALQNGPAKSQPDAAQIVSLLRAGQYETAHQTIQNLLRTRPQDCELHSFDGLALNGMKQVEAAGKAFRQALRSCPHDLLALEGAAQAAYALKSPDTADLLQRVLVLRPDDVTAHAMLASVDRAKQDCTAALPHFKASQKLFASSPKLQEGYAYCLMMTGDAAAAAANYRAVLDSRPDDTARYNLAIVLWKMHDPDAAWQILQPLLPAQASEDVLGLGAQLAEETGHTPEAVQLLRDAILRYRKDQDNYLRFAQISFAHNSCQVGINMLNAGLTQLPNAGRLYLARGVLEVQLSESDKAIADFEKAHHLEPQLSLAMDAIGILQSQQHENDSSLHLFEQEAKEHPNDSLLQFLYAEALSESPSERDSLSRAIKAAERSVEIDPGYEPAHDLLAKLYLRAGNLKRATDEAEAAERNDPADESAMYQELMATRRLGDTQKEKRLAQKFAELRKTNAEHQKQSNRFVLKDEQSH
jgi:Flp pilus assembly protein TadD